MFKYVFDEVKATQAASYLRSRHGGRCKHLCIIKMLYMADRRSLVDRGFPITGDGMFSLKSGPILSHSLNLAKELEEGSGYWQEVIRRDPPHHVKLRGTPQTTRLSAYELGVLTRIDEAMGHMSSYNWIQWTHDNLKEWHNPGSSSKPIDPKEILRQAGKNEAFIDEKEALAEEIYFLKKLANSAG